MSNVKTLGNRYGKLQVLLKAHKIDKNIHKIEVDIRKEEIMKNKFSIKLLVLGKIIKKNIFIFLTNISNNCQKNISNIITMNWSNDIQLAREMLFKSVFWYNSNILIDNVEGVDGAKKKDISTTEAEKIKTIIIEIFNFLYRCGKIK